VKKTPPATTSTVDQEPVESNFIFYSETDPERLEEAMEMLVTSRTCANKTNMSRKVKKKPLKEKSPLRNKPNRLLRSLNLNLKK
jgi:hypothetical protein